MLKQPLLNESSKNAVHHTKHSLPRPSHIPYVCDIISLPSKKRPSSFLRSTRRQSNHKKSRQRMSQKPSVHVFQSKPKNFQTNLEIAAIYLSVNNTLLFLKNASHKKEPSLWTVPSGKIETDETPITGATRELQEETGLHVESDQLTLLGTLYIQKPQVAYAYHLFSLEYEHFPTIQISTEHQTYQWVPKEKASLLQLMSGGKESLSFYYQNMRLNTQRLP